MPVNEYLSKIPSLLKSQVPEEMFKARYRFLYGGVLIQPINFTQGGAFESRSGSNREKYIMAPAMTLVPFHNKLVWLPILYGNTILGVMKNKIPEDMFNYYRDNKPEVLDGIYNVDEVSNKYKEIVSELRSMIPKDRQKLYTEESLVALSSTIFRLKPPFLSVSYATNKSLDEILNRTVRAVWYNPIFKAFGIGIAPWSPSRSIVSSVAMPLVKEFPLLNKFASDIAKGIKREIPEVADEISLFKVSLPVITKSMEESEPADLPEEEIKSIKMDFRELPGEIETTGMYPVVKLRQELASDFKKLGVTFDKDKFKIPVSSEKEKYDLTSPTPVRLAYSGPLTLLSVFSRGTRATLHTGIELGAFAYAMSDIAKFGPNDNVMRIYVLMKFLDVETEKEVTLASATGVGIPYANQTTVKFRGIFSKWYRNIEYDEVITPISASLLAIHVAGFRKQNSKKKGESKDE